MKTWMFVIATLLVSACGRETNPLAGVQEDEYVVRARAELQVTTDPEGRVFRANAAQNTTLSVTMAAATTFTLDKTQFIIPPITNNLLDFGRLRVSALTDNSLRVCGPSGNQKCRSALFRIFTTGVAGAGIFNAVENFGAPLTGTLTTTPLSIGLLVANAAVMQTITIPAAKQVVRLSDFSPAPNYNIKADFTNAGAGTYTTTIVVEYALAP